MIWRGILKDLLRTRRKKDQLSTPETAIEDSFEVAKRLAVLLTFSTHRERGLFSPSEELFEQLTPSTPTYPSRDDYLILRKAAYEVLKTTVFERTDDGFRFTRDHLREWFAALALQNMALLRVRPLLTDESGKPDPAHDGIMGILASISSQKQVRDWIDTAHGGVTPPSDSAPWSPQQAIRALGRLQELARSSSSRLDLWRGERLGNFAVKGVGAEIASRLGCSLQPTEQELLLDVARVIRASEPLGPAARILKDPTQDERVRILAAEFLVQAGQEENLVPLSQWARSGEATAAPDVLSVLTACFFEKGLWNFEETAEFALGPARLLSHSLQYLLDQALTLDRARWLIDKYLIATPGRISEHLLGRALGEVVKQEHLEEVDYGLLQPLMLNWEEVEGPGTEQLRDKLLQAFERNQKARRGLFLEGLRLDPECRHEGSWRWRFSPAVADVPWLIDLVKDRQAAPACVLETLYLRSRAPEVGEHLRARARKEIRRLNDQMLERLDRDSRKWKEEEKRRKARQQTNPKTYELATLTRDTLDTPLLDLRGKMLRLSWSCFTRPSLRPTNVNGRWEDLPDGLQQEVFSVCCTALADCEQTAVPDGSTFPISILWEAACFDRMVSEEVLVLASQEIRKWLPAILRGWERELGPTLRRCFEVDRQAAEDILVVAVLREIRSGEWVPPYLRQLPPDLWSEHLAKRLEEEIVEAESSAPDIRIEVLAQIARIFPGRAQVIALRWADERAAEPVSTFRAAAIDVLLMVAEKEGWPRLRSLLGEGNAVQILFSMRSLQQHHYGPDADFSSWPSTLLGELSDWLHRTFPEETSVRLPGEVISVDAEYDLRSLRASLPSLLFRRNWPGDADALDQLAATWPEVRKWLDQERAQHGVEGVLAGVNHEPLPPPGPARTVPVEKLIRLLQDERYRLVRTVDDLQDVILEELDVIARDAQQHLAMLYHPQPKKKQEKRQRLDEEALQAYICCRLRDRLVPAGLTRLNVFFDRETLAARNQRNDVKVQAASPDGKQLTVIIEVKWSDNAALSSAQVKQLAEDYLLKNGLTHGIYLVGWCGKPLPWNRQELGEPPAERSSFDSWRQALEDQALRLRELYPSLAVKPFFLYLCWKEPEG